MFKNLPDNIVGVIYIFASALMYAALPIMAKFAYTAGLTPVYLLWLRYGFAFVIIAGLLGFAKQGPLVSLSPLAIGQGVLMIVSGIFYFLSLQYLSAGLCSIIFFTHPVLVSLLARVVFKEKLLPRVIAGLIMAVAGIVLIAGITGNIPLDIPVRGLVFCILACIIYAGYILTGQKNLANFTPLTLTSTFALVGIILLPLLFGQSQGFFKPLNTLTITLITGMALFNTVVPILFLLKGIQKIGAGRGSLISSIEPALTILIAFLVLGETMAPIQLLGSVLILISMVLAIPSPPANQAALDISSQAR
jgi:drug/metabolite transporter (DMT)-like permease